MLSMDRKKHFDTLFHAYYAKLFFYASGIVGNDGDAEDVVEEVFCDLWTHIDTMEMGDRIQAFLYRAVFTRSLNMLKRNALRQRVWMLQGRLAICVWSRSSLRLPILMSAWRMPRCDAR